MASNFPEFNRSVWKFDTEWTVIRLIGEMRSVYEHWIPILIGNKRVFIPKVGLNWDSKRHRSTDDVCPYSRAGLEGRVVYYSNAIIRRLQQVHHPLEHLIKFHASPYTCPKGCHRSRSGTTPPVWRAWEHP